MELILTNVPVWLVIAQTIRPEELNENENGEIKEIIERIGEFNIIYG